MRRRKYGNEPTEYDGRVYDSKAEARRAWELNLLLRSGVVKSVRRQPQYKLGPDHKYRADFEVVGHDEACAKFDDWRRGEEIDRYVCVCGDGNIWTEEVKGPHTREFARHKRMWRKYGPHTLIVLYAKGASGWRREDVPGLLVPLPVKANGHG